MKAHIKWWSRLSSADKFHHTTNSTKNWEDFDEQDIYKMYCQKAESLEEKKQKELLRALLEEEMSITKDIKTHDITTAKTTLNFLKTCNFPEDMDSPESLIVETIVQGSIEEALFWQRSLLLRLYQEVLTSENEKTNGQ